VFVDLNEVLTVCKLSDRQKYAVLRQGIQEIKDVTMLGSLIDDIRDIFSGFNRIAKNRGGVNFGALHYTRILYSTFVFKQ